MKGENFISYLFLFLDEKNIAGAIVTKEGQCVLSARALNNFGI